MRTKTITAIAFLMAVSAVSCTGGGGKGIAPLRYPDAPKGDVTDNYHGTVVADPYRWLENDSLEQTSAWIEAQKRLTEQYMSRIPFRDRLRGELERLYDYPRMSVPARVGDWVVTSRNDGLQNQSVMYIRHRDSLQERVLLDPNLLSDDGTVAVSSVAFSDDGRHMCYSVSESGSDWVTVCVRSVPDGRLLDDRIRWVKYSGGVWSADGKGFYYSRYDEPQAGGELTDLNSDQRVYYHLLGTSQEEDTLVYSDPEHPMLYNDPQDADDGRWQFIYTSEGTSGMQISFRRAGDDGFRVLFPGFSNEYSVVSCRDDIAYVRTNLDAPRYRLVRVDLNSPERMEEVIPEAEDLLNGVSVVGGYIIATYLRDASDMVVQFDMDGNRVREVELDPLVTTSGFQGKPSDTDVFFSETGYLMPQRVFRYDLATGEREEVESAKVGYDPSELVAERVFYPSHDGTMVPLFIVRRADIALDGTHPTYLYGYGGFNISYTPSYRPWVISLAMQGGVYALAGIRGGSEYGEEWHRAGMLSNKQNVFDDFAAAAEYLIGEGYTSPSRLAIAGGSNGGLLVGACMLQRPDLYAVALPSVGVMDMLRFHLFTCGWGWTVEYGCSENPDQFPFIYAYSPLHNIRPGTRYPATMVTTADHDDRVVPAHSYKFTATLQAAQGGDAPVIIRIDSDAGHGSGKPTSKVLDELADELSFMYWNMDFEYR